MVIYKVNPVGIDYLINKMQNYLYEKLLLQWGLTEDNSKFFPRCYKQNKEGLFFPMVLTGIDYDDLFLDDSLKCQSFFSVSDESIYNSETQESTISVDVYFIVNIAEIYGGREDEKVRREVIGLFRHEDYGFKYKGVVKGIDAVFREYTGFRLVNSNYSDMQPHHVFRIKTEVTYQETDCIII